jgi:hypothetical protein
MQSFDVCDDGLVGKSTVVRKQSANFRVSTPLVTGTDIAVAGSSCSRGAEKGAFDAGPSTIALTFDSLKPAGKAALLTFPNRNRFSSCQDWRLIITRY